MQNNVDFGSKPKFVMCFVCGREFSKASLEIHFYQCVKKAETEYNKVIDVPEEYLIFFDKIKTNQKISFGDIEDFNEFSNMLFKSKTMAACPYCNRRFLKDRLEVHLRSCKPKDNINNNNSNKNSKILDSNLIKNINNARSIEKIKNTTVSNLNSINVNKSSNFNVKNIKVVENGNSNIKKWLGLSSNETNKLDIKEQNCPNCNEKVIISKLPLHLTKCTGKIKREQSQNKFNPRNSYAGSIESKTNINFNNNNNSKMKPFSPEKKYLDNNKGNNDNNNNNITSQKDSQYNKTFGPGEKIKPCFLVCYICGREFGKTSLEIHLKTCKIKFINGEEISNSTNTNFRKSQNINLPEPPHVLNSLLEKINLNQNISNTEFSEYNALAERIYKEKSLKPCPGCKRTFVREALEVHLKSCKSGQKAKESEPTHMKMTQRPRMLLCPLCGREFGTMSLEIHIKTCRNKFDLEQQSMPLNLRRKSDVILEKYYANVNREKNGENDIKISGNKGKDAFNFDKLNDDAYEIFSKEALVPCENCGRTFLPDRLLVHLRSCKGKKEQKGGTEKR